MKRVQSKLEVKDEEIRISRRNGAGIDDSVLS